MTGRSARSIPCADPHRHRSLVLRDRARPSDLRACQAAPRLGASIDIAQSCLQERFAHVVHVEAENAGGKLGALVAFERLTRFGGFGDTRDPGCRDADYAVVVRDDRVPRVNQKPAQTTGTLTEPRVALMVPCDEINRLQTGNLRSKVLTSRTPASITRARAPLARKEVASRSPK